MTTNTDNSQTTEMKIFELLSLRGQSVRSRFARLISPDADVDSIDAYACAELASEEAEAVYDKYYVDRGLDVAQRAYEMTRASQLSWLETNRF